MALRGAGGLMVGRCEMPWGMGVRIPRYASNRKVHGKLFSCGEVGMPSRAGRALERKVLPMLKLMKTLKAQLAALPLALALAMALMCAPLLGGCAADNNAADNAGDGNAMSAEMESPNVEGDGAQTGAPGEENKAAGASGTAAEGSDAAKLTVTVTVNSATDESAALFQEEMAVDEGTTALGALKATGLDVTVEESSYGPYVTAIGEVAAEANSGWTYTVNGEEPTVGASETILKEGDQLTWNFVTF